MMHEIRIIGEIEESQNYEFWHKGKRLITLSINPSNLSLQIPGGIDPAAMSKGEGSFFLRTKDRDARS